MGKLTLVTPSSAGDPEFWPSESELVEDGEGGFEVYCIDQAFIAEFVYAEEDAARGAVKAMGSVLTDAILLEPRMSKR